MTGGGHGRGVLEDYAVSQIRDGFVVPDYQRGYRWGPTEVTQLLDDICAAESEQRYYLQPVVVKKDGAEWELVDGQQRLTTLFLIMRYLHKEGHAEHGPGFWLRYATRPDSREYLESPTEGASAGNVDFHHIYGAYRTITSWAQARDPATLRRLAADFENKVRILWFAAPDNLSGEEMFLRLNSGRIALTDAELVKALILDRVSADRAVTVAAQWDGFEQDLRDPQVWAFIAGDRPDASHIGILLDALADRLKPPPDPRPPFHTFNAVRESVEARGAQAVWDEVVGLHSLALGWSADSDLYHHVGYLVAIQERTFPQLVAESRTRSRTQFQDHLRRLVTQTIPDSPDGLLHLGYDNRHHRGKLERALLLMNVETVRREGRERFPFAHHQIGDRTRTWSLEHIRPQTARPLNEKARTSWLIEHSQVLDQLPDSDRDEVQALRARIAEASRGQVSAETFEELHGEVLTVMDVDEFDLDQVHAVTNLALLLREQNSALSNNAFEIKRRTIICLDREGKYVPACTRYLFLKYYTPGTPVLHYWGDRDRQGYLEEITSLFYSDDAFTAGAHR